MMYRSIAIQPGETVELPTFALASHATRNTIATCTNTSKEVIYLQLFDAPMHPDDMGEFDCVYDAGDPKRP